MLKKNIFICFVRNAWTPGYIVKGRSKLQARSTLKVQYHFLTNTTVHNMKQIFHIGFTLALVTLFAFTSAGPNDRAIQADGILKKEWNCQLPAPGYCNGERTGTSTAYLEWASVQSAVSYSLTVYDLSNSEIVQNSVISGTSTDLSGLQAGKSYRCVVAAICSGGSTSSFIIVEDIMD